MKVIFLKNIKGVAQIGDIKNVADGYARNFLLPRKIAQLATAESNKLAETLRNTRELDFAHRKERGLELVKKLEGMTLEIKEDANDQGHLYGSISAKTIAQKLLENKINIPQEVINLKQHLKNVGQYEVELEFHPEVKTIIRVLVSPN